MGGYVWEVATGAGAIVALELRTKVAKEQVRNSLLAFKRQNYPVDPDNLERQEKHRQMRLKFNRVSPAQFISTWTQARRSRKPASRARLPIG